MPINDLSSIPSEDLGPFLNQEKDLLCIGNDKQVTLASLSEARLGHLVAQVKDSKGAESFLLWRGSDCRFVSDGSSTALCFRRAGRESFFN